MILESHLCNMPSVICELFFFLNDKIDSILLKEKAQKATSLESNTFFGKWIIHSYE